MSQSLDSNLFRGRYWNELASISADAQAHRLGSGGLFVQTDEAPASGVLLDFELAIGDQPPVKGVVEVIEARAATDATTELPAGMRVRFVHLEDPTHAQEVLQRVVVQPSASLPPPAIKDDESEPASKRGAVWDRLGLETAFFERADAEPVTVADDEVAEALERRRAEPRYVARQQKLRRAFGAVVAVAALLFAATAMRGMTTRAIKDAPATVAPGAKEPSAAPAKPAPVPQVAPPDAPVPEVAPSAVAPTLAPSVASSGQPSAAAPPVASAPPAAGSSSVSSSPPAASSPPPRPVSRPAAAKKARPVATPTPAPRAGGDSIYD